MSIDLSQWRSKRYNIKKWREKEKRHSSGGEERRRRERLRRRGDPRRRAWRPPAEFSRTSRVVVTRWAKYEKVQQKQREFVIRSPAETGELAESGGTVGVERCEVGTQEEEQERLWTEKAGGLRGKSDEQTAES
jgi:hypothetical protein